MPSPPATAGQSRSRSRVARVHRPEREIDPAPDEHRGDRGVEQPLRDVVGDERAEDRADDRRRRHPRDDAPVDAALARVADRAGSGRRGRDRDVRPGGRDGLPVSATISGRRSVPSTSPSIEPTYPATNEPARASASSQASTAARRRRGVRRAGEDEEQVGEPVQVAEHERVQIDLLRPEQDVALGAAADRPRDVEPRGRLGAARQDEAAQLRQVGVEVVAELLERVDHRLLDAEAVGHAPRHGEIGADVEELVLDPGERLAHRLRHVAGEHDAEGGVELVDGAERTDPAVELGHPRAVAERGLALVAAAGVDPRQADGLVRCSRAHAASSRIRRAITRRWISLVPS